MHTPLRFCIALGLLLAIAPIIHAKAILQGTVSFLNSGSRPAAGVKISAFGANDFYTTDAGMFRLEFPDKKPGDKVKIIVGSNDRDGLALELVNDKVLAQVRIPSNSDDDIVEIIVCKIGQRNDAALRYNGLLVKTINETIEKRLHEIDEKLGAAKIDAETIIALQNEKEKLAEERDSALAKAEEQALYIASINLDKASQLVRDAVSKVDSLHDIAGAIAVLDNENLYQAYLDATEKKRKAEIEILQVVAGFEFKIKLLEAQFRQKEIIECCNKIESICAKEHFEISLSSGCFSWALFDAETKEKKKRLSNPTLLVTGIGSYNKDGILSNYLNNNDSILRPKTDINSLRVRLYYAVKDALKKNESQKPNANFYRDWAIYYALQNNKAKAIENLQKAVSLGYKDLKWIETDDSLESIRGEPGYKEIVEQLKKGQ